MSANSTAGLNFLQSGTALTDAEYLNFLKDKSNIHMIVHNCNTSMRGGVPFSESKLVKNYLQEKMLMR